MTRVEYQERLDAVREDVLYMGELVRERLRMGLDALAEKDDATAREVMNNDDEINDLYLELEADCVDLLALQQPVASDLRFVAASFKIITDLERIGDLATNLGEYALSADASVYPDVDVVRLGEVASEMLADALDAYDNADADAPHAIDARDDELDELCADASDEVVRGLIESEAVEDSETLLAEASRLLLTIRDLERVGDHAVNIAARTLYMTDSDESLIY